MSVENFFLCENSAFLGGAEALLLCLYGVVGSVFAVLA